MRWSNSSSRHMRCDLARAKLTLECDVPLGFGRIVRDEDGAIAAIVEDVDCTPEESAIHELNPGCQ